MTRTTTTAIIQYYCIIYYNRGEVGAGNLFGRVQVADMLVVVFFFFFPEKFGRYSPDRAFVFVCKGCFSVCRVTGFN